MKIGDRIEIPAHYDLWMRGARTGEITAFRHSKGLTPGYFLVKMDHPQVKHRVKLPVEDWNYAKVIS